MSKSLVTLVSSLFFLHPNSEIVVVKIKNIIIFLQNFYNTIFSSLPYLIHHLLLFSP